MGKLTDKERAALRSAFFYTDTRRESASCIGHSAHVLGSLARKGLLSSVTQTENPLHERPFSYQLYRITDAGRAALNTEEPRG